ncbi:ABC transporter transmembrane domain-containing protein [Photobacterium lutimaris]|uniref:ABC transporter ATP-binding protein n=1 Tax=Photobacterium lutimaris TaxID=388278 RepID=A0A2T3J3C7_9GAMM|nr:ABC transporter transmembrane domain-containing protein [Photobacterium lutimaris]PSU35794.1 ABC transporter ATP-binding protein [Photobacterium lutimaris]TDR78865.1 ABC-type bacteriocin/lantibiotic exporter with double-glycine peptidase domain [Photobacterium lutimaris]
MKSQPFTRKISPLDKLYLLFSTLMTTLLGLVLPFSILIIFDRILPNQSTHSLMLLFAIILIAIFLDYQLKRQEEHLVSVIMKHFEGQLTNRVFLAICAANIERFNQREMGEYLERIATISDIKQFFGGETIKAMINAGTSAITVLIILLINVWAGLALIAASTVLFFAARHLSQRRVDVLSQRSDIEGLTNSKIIEIVSNPLDIKSRTMEYRIESVMVEMIGEREDQSITYERLESSFNLILNVIQQLSVAIVVVLCALAVINMEISQGVMAAVILLTNRYFAPYQQVMRTLSRWRTNQLNVKRIAEVLELESLNHASHAEKTINTISITPINSNVTTGTPAMSFATGEINLLTGSSGSGKSHLLRCLTRDSHDDNLAFIINDKLADEIDYAKWRHNVIKVDKHSALVEGTIIDNLTCFQPHLNSAAFSLCENLAIKHKIDGLKNGFYTKISSHSQLPFSRQVRFALLIVRALLSNKPVLLIDDIDMVYDEQFARLLLACITPKANNFICIIVSNKLGQLDPGLVRHKLVSRVAA